MLTLLQLDRCAHAIKEQRAPKFFSVTEDGIDMFLVNGHISLAMEDDVEVLPVVHLGLIPYARLHLLEDHDCRSTIAQLASTCLGGAVHSLVGYRRTRR